MTTRLLLSTKDARLREWERDFEMAQCIIQYYKDEHKHFKKVKRGLAIQKKMTKHYAKKNMLACAKLNEALMEIKNLKMVKEHDSHGFLSEASQQVSKTF